MNLMDRLTQLVTSKDAHQAPEGLCPNCWGRQEYSGAFFEAIKREGVDVMELDNTQGWIRAYAMEHFEAITLQTIHQQPECPTCKVNYKQKS